MHGAVLAAVTPSNTPGGSNLTAMFPTAIFIIQAVVLYMRFRRKPRAVPGQAALATGQWASRGGAGGIAATATATAAGGSASGGTEAAGTAGADGGGSGEAEPADQAGQESSAAVGDSADSGGPAGPGD